MTIFTRKQGTVITTSVVFTKRADATPAGPADPGVVTLLVEPPGGPTDTYVWPTGVDIVRDGLGAFHLDLPTANDLPGVWTVSWRGSGSGPNVVVDGNFQTDSSAIDVD